MRSLGVVVALTLAPAFAAAPAYAQSMSDAGRRVKLGDTIYVQDRLGRTTEGTLDSISTSVLTMKSPALLEFPADQIVKITKLGDPYWDGALKGAAVGFPLGFINPACSTRWVCAVAGALSTGALAAFVDWAHVGRTVIFRGPGAAPAQFTLTPMVTPDRRGITLTVVF